MQISALSMRWDRFLWNSVVAIQGFEPRTCGL